MTPEPLRQFLLTSSNFTIGHYLVDTYKGRDEFDLEAPYQRQSVWNDEKRRGLIKSLIMGVPVGSVTLALASAQSLGPYYRVVDGKQRIEAIRAFVDGQFTVPGWWFGEKLLNDPSSRQADVSWAELSPQGRLMLKMANLPAVEFKPEVEYNEQEDGSYTHRTRTADEILQAEAELYLLLNFGGVAQTDEDMERAVDVAEGR